LGDCGYGILLLIASLFVRRSKNEFLSSAGKLATYLGIGTILFGFVSGGFFGISIPDLQVSWLQPLKGIILGPNQLFTFALVIGGIQIAYGITIKGITQWMRYGLFYSLDSFGWLLTLLGNGAVYLLANKGVINPEFQSTAHIVVSSLGGFMMLFFNSPEKGFSGVPGSIGSGLFGLYTKASGLMGDLLSYIRLFALGISGSVMALVFNQLAIGFAPDIIIVKQLVMIAILLFGHGINIFMNTLGALIHPMRLTFVEFYNNAGFEGGGKAYEPFRISG
jgi:V/A-type H+-transporting ATPase subunit I